MTRKLAWQCRMLVCFTLSRSVSTLWLPPIPHDTRLTNIVASGVRRREVTTTTETANGFASTTGNPVNRTKTTESEMKRLIFVGTVRNLELHNQLNPEDIVRVIFTRSIHQCTYICKLVIGIDHFNNHVNKYDPQLGKCMCYLLNQGQQQFQPPLHDFSWAPGQSRYQYSVHRKKHNSFWVCWWSKRYTSLVLFCFSWLSSSATTQWVL